MDGNQPNQPDSGNTNPPPANEPPANQQTNVAPTPKPPVQVNTFDPAQLMNAVESLPEKVANVFKEMVPTTPPPPANQSAQSTQATPPANQPPAQTRTPAQPATQNSGSKFANWFFGTNK
jgi:hypothetical protein